MPKRCLATIALGVLIPVLILAQEKKEETQITYKDGIVIKSADGKFSMKLNTRVQYLFSLDDRDLGNTRQTTPSFNVRRARIVWNGNAYYPWLKYEMQLTLEGASLGLRDYWLDFTNNARVQPRLGQFKLPFNREFLTSTAALQFVERSIVNDVFQLGRDIGVALRGNLSGDKFEYGFGAFNGSAKNRPNQDRALMYVGRAMLNLAGKGAYSQADLEHSEKPIFAVGAALALLPNFKPAAESVDDRRVLGDAVRSTTSAVSDVTQFTTDVLFKSKGFSFEGEFHTRNLNPAEAILPGLKANGLRLQIGYCVVPGKYEIALRFATVDPNTDADNDAARELTPACSYYIAGHRLKLQAEVSFLTQQASGDDMNDRRARTQFQFMF